MGGVEPAVESVTVTAGEDDIPVPPTDTAPAGPAGSPPAGLPILGVYLLVAIALVTAGLTIRRTKR